MRLGLWLLVWQLLQTSRPASSWPLQITWLATADAGGRSYGLQIQTAPAPAWQLMGGARIVVSEPAPGAAPQRSLAPSPAETAFTRPTSTSLRLHGALAFTGPRAAFAVAVRGHPPPAHSQPGRGAGATAPQLLLRTFGLAAPAAIPLLQGAAAFRPLPALAAAACRMDVSFGVGLQIVRQSAVGRRQRRAGSPPRSLQTAPVPSCAASSVQLQAASWADVKGAWGPGFGHLRAAGTWAVPGVYAATVPALVPWFAANMAAGWRRGIPGPASWLGAPRSRLQPRTRRRASPVLKRADIQVQRRGSGHWRLRLSCAGSMRADVQLFARAQTPLGPQPKALHAPGSFGARLGHRHRFVELVLHVPGAESAARLQALGVPGRAGSIRLLFGLDWRLPRHVGAACPRRQPSTTDAGLWPKTRARGRAKARPSPVHAPRVWHARGTSPGSWQAALPTELHVALWPAEALGPWSGAWGVRLRLSAAAERRWPQERSALPVRLHIDWGFVAAGRWRAAASMGAGRPQTLRLAYAVRLLRDAGELSFAGLFCGTATRGPQRHPRLRLQVTWALGAW